MGVKGLQTKHSEAIGINFEEFRQLVTKHSVKLLERSSPPLIYLRDTKNLAPNTILNYKYSLERPMRVGFWINLKHKKNSLLIEGMFHDNPTPKKIIPS